MTPYISPSAGDATERFVINGIAFRRMTEAEIAILPPRKRRPPTVNRVDAESFLSALDPTATKFTFQVFPDGAGCKVAKKGRIEQGSVGKLWAILADFNRRGAGVFVTINETDFSRTSSWNPRLVNGTCIGW